MVKRDGDQITLDHWVLKQYMICDKVWTLVKKNQNSYYTWSNRQRWLIKVRAIICYLYITNKYLNSFIHIYLGNFTFYNEIYT